MKFLGFFSSFETHLFFENLSFQKNYKIEICLFNKYNKLIYKNV